MLNNEAGVASGYESMKAHVYMNDESVTFEAWKSFRGGLRVGSKDVGQGWKR